MLPEIELDVLCWLNREALEGMQIHSRYLRDLVKRNARILPLWYIHELKVLRGAVYIRVTDRDRDGIEVMTGGEQGLELFRTEDLRCLNHLRTKANDLQCLTSARIRRANARVDYALVDFLSSHLRPQVFEVTTRNDLSEDHVMLFAHKALRGNVKRLVYDVYNKPAPICIIPKLFGVDVVETCAIASRVEPRPWISKFIEKFETAERGTGIVRSVTLLHEHIRESSLVHAVDMLGQPRRTGVPPPHGALFMEWFGSMHGHRTATVESTAAELFVFENLRLAKKLEVFGWTIEQVFNSGRCALHYAFLLQAVDI